jgi:4-hydroxy-3-polyprenylbenzoate decarboxylase
MPVFDSLRDYLAEMDRRGNLLRVASMDQDRYEMTAFAYRLDDRLKADAPAFQVERTRIGGRWYDTPVVGNILNSYWTVALSLGVEAVSRDRSSMYDLAVTRIAGALNENHRWRTLPPEAVDREYAPCKEVVLAGADADLGRFPWIWNNPADGGQYISAGAVVVDDPELGRNVGTHRMLVKGPRKLGLDLSTQSHCYRYVQRAKERGLDRLPVSVAVGIDPVSWMMSCTRLAEFGEDEFAIAGGFRGRPVRLVRSETSDLLVPAEAEIVIEGFIPMEKEWEGPYGEMLGYIGEKKLTYSIDVHTITHRRKPIVFNIWPGIGGAYMTLAWEVGPFVKLREIVPDLVRLHTPPEIPSICIACIDKKVPGQGIETGMAVLGYRMTGFHKKMVIVVDQDVDPTDLTRVMHAVGTRWQPDPASLVVRQSFHFLLDPSTHRNFLSSKIVIDATRQFPAEGGPKQWAEDNRAALVTRAPDAFRLVDENWDSYLRDWRPS